jgi:ankyrin repeat protein
MAYSEALRSAIVGFAEHSTESKQIIKLLVEHGANINAQLRLPRDKPVYHIRSPEALDYLLSLGVVPDADGYDGLVVAVARDPNIKDPVQILNLVVSHGGQLTGSPDRDTFVLKLVVKQHRTELAEFLLANGFSPNLRDESGRTALFDAADAATIEVLLRRGAALEALDTYRSTPLSDAIAKKDVAKSLLLLSWGANPNVFIGPPSWKVTGVQFAIENDELDLVSALVTKGADVNGRAASGLTPLESAIRRGQADVLELLLAHGANVNATASSGEVMASAVACYGGTEDPIRILTILLDHGARLASEPERGHSILHCAVIAHRVDLEEFLLTRGVSPDLRDAWGRTALFDAADADTVDPLLRHNVDLEAVNKVDSSALADAVAKNEVLKSLRLLAGGANPDVLLGGEWGEPLISVAAAHGQLQIVSDLLARGVRLNTQDRSGQTALHAAVDAGQLETTEFLIAHGADVNGKDFRGRSALHHAGIHNNVAMVTFLLSQHADVTAQDNQGRPPYRFATSEEVIALFERNGAPVEPRSPTKMDAAACQQVVHSKLWKERQNDGADSDSPIIASDPRDNWDFQTGVLRQDIREKVLHLGAQDYVLGVWTGKAHWVFLDDEPNSGPTPPDVQARLDYEMSHQKSKQGPVYLARLGSDQVEMIVCEYKRTGSGFFERYSVMTPSERLRARPPEESPE